ncbi:hypothetical protein [Dyadobacter pollutisoli]|uniref:GAF domain-containing protein n=1 Tax=Dyadobacter pollutisoli TaxID=2910158 RepID=A0A9E8SNH8_9BACT|nr:hypothetical protein [Dyadobacter pollutisoli]WAC15273.1 hypothetical protein ON006_15160 [Dyadobacter pollutisoli]
MDFLNFSDSPLQVQLCFGRVIENLERSAMDPDNPLAEYEKALLLETAKIPQLKHGITDPRQVTDNLDLIHRLFADFFPKALTLNEIKAISLPYSGLIFNHTERFKNILNAAGIDFDINIRDFGDHQFYVSTCCLVLMRYYHVPLDFSTPLFYDIPTANGVVKHYRILYNGDFVDIVPTEKSVELTSEDIELLRNNYEDLALWKAKFPPGSWIVRGFAIMSLYDATVESAVSLLKEKLLGINTVDFRESIYSVFQSIYQIPDLAIGFTVFNQEEGKFSPDTFGQQLPSFMLHDTVKVDVRQILCEQSYENLIVKKVYFSISDTTEFYAKNSESPLAAKFLSQGIHSFILAPIVKNNYLYGILEVVSVRPKELNSINANKLAVVMPFLTDTIERLAAELENQVQAVIQEKFTSIHSSVYWKFNAEAQKLIHYRQLGEAYELREVIFPEVHPLYGQIDIKGSSEARNASVQSDLTKQITALLSLLETIEERTRHTGMFQTERRKLSSYLTDLAISLKASTEQYINSYVENSIHLRFNEVKDPECAAYIDLYLKETSKETGDFHASRRRYETTISVINDKMARIIDHRQEQAQTNFPHYYERFKTDGIEHNLYIGPSISPGKTFSLTHLSELRLWQLATLCEMEIAHQKLKMTLPYPLEVTTLILVYHATIDIHFRLDEKRFDVHGSYNARYEIVKKRIDKAFVRGTDERITQPGKVAIVYSSSAIEDEYLGYIQTLQKRGLLGNMVEKLEVEDLQGVSGLKVLRASLHHG